MLPQLIKKNLSRLKRDSPGSSLMELSVSLMLMSLTITGFVGSVGVGARVESQIEDQDASLVIARSQAEFIASQPAASSYSVYPSVPPELVVTADAITLRPDVLQRLSIRVGRTGDNKEGAALDTLKALRFLSPGNGQQEVVPKSGGLERVKTITTVPAISPQNGFAVVISQVFSSTRATDLLVRWEVSLSTGQGLRTLAVYKSRPFGSQTQGITIAPSSVSAPLISIGQLRGNPVLPVAARNVGTGDFTIYLFNDSNAQSIETRTLEIGCVCTIEP